MISAFSDSLMASWGGPPPDILGSTKGMTMKFLPDVGICKETRNKKCLMQLQGTLALRNFAGLSILKIPDRYLKDWLFYRTICKMPKKLVCKIQNGL